MTNAGRPVGQFANARRTRVHRSVVLSGTVGDDVTRSSSDPSRGWPVVGVGPAATGPSASAGAPASSAPVPVRTPTPWSAGPPRTTLPRPRTAHRIPAGGRDRGPAPGLCGPLTSQDTSPHTSKRPRGHVGEATYHTGRAAAPDSSGSIPDRPEDAPARLCTTTTEVVRTSTGGSRESSVIKRDNARVTRSNRSAKRTQTLCA